MVRPKRTQTVRQLKARWPSSLLARSRELLKRPGAWMLGIVGTVAAGYVTATFTEMTKPLSRYLSEKACELRRASFVSDESRFTILVSPLGDDDSNGSHTRRLLGAFHGERGFRPVLICTTLGFDLAGDLQEAEEETVKRGADLIVRNRADLLIFGSVLDPQKSIRIWAINEHGGCELRPKPIVLRDGILPDEFNNETRMKIIAATLREIASACQGEQYVDWDVFERRMQKFSTFIERSTVGLHPEQLAELAASYSNAMLLLYAHDRGEAWYDKALAFNLQEIQRLPHDASHYRRYLLLNAYADLLGERAARTRFAADRHAALDAYDKAIAEAESDVQQHHKYAEAYVGRNLGWLDPENVYRAIRDYDRAIKIDPNYAEAFEARGWAYTEKGDYKRALTDYGTATKLNPKRAYAFHARGDAYARMGNYERAIKEFDEAIRLNPKYAHALIARGFAYEQRGDRDRALRDFDDADKVNPKKDFLLVERGFLYFGKKDYDRAILDFTSAIELNPKNEAATYGRGKAYVELRDYDRAIQDYERVIGLNPKDDRNFVGRGDAYAQSGDHDRAIDDYDQAIRVNPRSYVALLGRALSYELKGDSNRAIQDYDQAINLAQTDAMAFLARASALTRIGQFERAFEDYGRILHLDPELAPVALCGRGIAHSNSGQYDLAIADYDSALRLAPNWPVALFGRGVAKLKKGDTVSGNADMGAARKTDPGIAESFAKAGGQL
jgi:tetratricopeptide (TPR) repeat protein